MFYGTPIDVQNFVIRRVLWNSHSCKTRRDANSQVSESQVLSPSHLQSSPTFQSSSSSSSSCGVQQQSEFCGQCASYLQFLRGLKTPFAKKATNQSQGDKATGVTKCQHHQEKCLKGKSTHYYANERLEDTICPYMVENLT